MADLNFSQPERRNFAAPILIALAVLGIAIALVLRFTPHTTADVVVRKTAVYAAHTVFKSESTVIGRDPSQDDLYVLVTLHIDNHLRLPLFLKDFTATLTPANSDGSSGEPITTSTAQKLDLPALYTSFPDLQALAAKQGTSPLLRETQIDPGKSAEGFLLLHFPTTEAMWDQRKSATITIDLYHQQPISVEVPKS